MSASLVFQVSLIAFTSCVVYSGVASGPFLYDDEAAILRNTDVQGNTSLWSIWSNDYWGVPMNHYTSHLSYRPLTVLYFRFLHLVWGNWATPFHISNIILHATVSSLFFLVCRKHVFNHDYVKAPVVAGLLFSLHPIHTEAVCGIVGCAELLSAICFMTSLLIYPTNVNHCDFKDKTLEANNSREIRADEDWKDTKVKKKVNLRYRKSKMVQSEAMQNKDTGIRKASNHLETLQIKGSKRLAENFRVLFSMLLAATAMLCKESGMTALGVLIALEAIQSMMTKGTGRSFLQDLDNRLIIRSTLICTAIISLIAFRMWMMDWRQPKFQDYDNPVVKLEDRPSRIMSYFSLCWVNFALLLYPVYLCYDYSFPTVSLITSIWHPRNIVSASFLALCVFCIVFIMRCFTDKKKMSKTFVMGCSMLVLPFLPASNLFFPVGFVIAERCLYLPSAGFIILVVWSCSTAMKLLPSSRRLLQATTALLIVAYFVLTAKRSLDWTSKEKLFRSGVEVNPRSAKILYNWGNHFLALDLKTEAEAEFKKSVELNPNFIPAINNLASSMEKRDPKTWPKVEELYEQITKTNPGYVLAHVNLANVCVKQQKIQKAVKTALFAMKAFPAEHLNKFSSVAKHLLDFNKTVEAEAVYYQLLNKVCQIENDNLETQKCLPGYTDTLKEYTYLLGKKGQKKKSPTVEHDVFKNRFADPDSLHSLSKTMFAAGDVEGAAAAMLKAAKLDRNKMRDLWQMAQNLAQKKQFRESRLLYEYYVTVFPNDLDTAAIYVGTLIESGEAERGESMLVTMTSKDLKCQNVRALLNLATMYGRKSKHIEAMELLNLCLERRKRSAESSNDAMIKSNLLTQLAKHGKYRSVQMMQNGDRKSADKLLDSSLKYLDEALQLYPSNTIAKQLKQEMESIKRQ